jgi:ribonucleotide monophosphatase NagD (HAD superfamily)
MSLLSKSEVFGSAYASAVYLSTVVKLSKDKKVYVIGEAGLEEELDEEGVAHTGGTVRNLLDLHQIMCQPLD